MNKYELGVVFKPNLEEDALKEELGKVQELIARFGGTVEKTDEWGKRRLAYEIKYFTEGFYVYITFTAASGAPAEIESRMRIMENVLRYLIIREDE